MGHFHVSGHDAGCVQCLVCEKTITDDKWFAQVKHGDWTVLLCSERCAKAFYARRLPGLRQFVVLAAHPLLKWPQAKTGLEQPGVAR